MNSKIGLFLSTLLLVQLIFLGFVEAEPQDSGCRPGLMMCNRNNKGKRGELRNHLALRNSLAADAEKHQNFGEEIHKVQDSNHGKQRKQTNPNQEMDYLF
ncbi:hypothetical protein OS493_023925 [Desmophyllum pertusum]|uniref:Uncharacterized protein n=1 Tax=Desmophyllum pertusum TaxID=174260 RepID=A0A9X0CE33_9CNID|nr:hypothetical protein OS493_023925 [Desmophyllum pertusum]